MLTQAEADGLLAMRKTFIQLRVISLAPGSDETHDLVGGDGKEQFLLDLARGSIRLSKLKFQTRAKKIVVLARLDVDGAPHTNPDGTPLGRTHIHLYREGYEDRWAFPVRSDAFSDLADPGKVLDDFLRYCNVDGRPSLQGSLL
jgi:hypothetical protein